MKYDRMFGVGSGIMNNGSKKEKNKEYLGFEHSEKGILRFSVKEQGIQKNEYRTKVSIWNN